MSAKRRPGTELNHENWDDDEETEEVGEFKKAAPEEIKKRIIRVAKRRIASANMGGSDDTDAPNRSPSSTTLSTTSSVGAVASASTTSSAFSSFGGFGKLEATAPVAPFSFLSNSAAFSTPKPSSNFSDGKSDKPVNGSSLSIKPNDAKQPNFSAGDVAESSTGKPMTYFAKLKGLNQTVSDWVAKHVNENPLCILTPIFDDYAKHLKEIEESSKSDSISSIPVSSSKANNGSDSVIATTFSFASTTASKIGPTLAASTSSAFSFGIGVESKTSPEPAKSSFFKSTTTAPGITFGTTPASGTGFSFGGASSTPFTFANVKKPDEHAKDAAAAAASNADDDNEEPPKNEFTPVVEQDSLYSKRCKIFVKTTGEYADRGIGTLFIKSADDGKKTQLLVRAETNLGNILLNILLTEAIAANRMGKNNVVMICLPTPESKPPPSTVLVRVKSADEADELLAQINKHKK